VFSVIIIILCLYFYIFYFVTTLFHFIYLFALLDLTQTALPLPCPCPPALALFPFVLIGPQRLVRPAELASAIENAEAGSAGELKRGTVLTDARTDRLSDFILVGTR
jgi:hypothetical protein